MSGFRMGPSWEFLQSMIEDAKAEEHRERARDLRAGRVPEPLMMGCSEDNHDS